MTNRKKLRARHRNAKRRRAAKAVETLKLDLRYAEANLSEANREMAAMSRALTGKVLVVLDYSTTRDLVRDAITHRLEARAAVWSGGRLRTAEDPVRAEMRVDNRVLALERDTTEGMLASVREQLGGHIGAAVLRNMQPRRG